MQSDIVERLRGAASKDYGCQCPKCEAADEIERLRADLAAAIKERDGYLEGNRQTLRALQEANEIAARYKRQRDSADAECREANASWCREVNESIDLFKQLAAMRQQRDEARREACLWALPQGVEWNEAMIARGKAIAAERGWDCYETEEGGGA